MKSATQKQESQTVVYDAGLMDVPDADIFCADFWEARQALDGEAVGRGSAWFINAPFGPVVLRQYLRGGWAAALSRQSYFFTTVARSRPVREYHLLATLYDLGLPVPRPVAALCKHHWFISSGAILTARISPSQTLTEFFPGGEGSNRVDTGFWERVGVCIRRFHDAGVWHADLNARNILLNDDLKVFLIDFDRARFTPGKVINRQGNLNRLKRSLVKLWPAAESPALETAWIQLLAGYHE